MDKKNIKYVKSPNSVSSKLRMFLYSEMNDKRDNAEYIEEIILLQMIIKLLTAPPQKRQQLVVRQQMPIAAHDRNVPSAPPFLGDVPLRRKPHLRPDCRNLIRRRPNDTGHPFIRETEPIPPDKRTHPVRKRVWRQCRPDFRSHPAKDHDTCQQKANPSVPH